MSSPSTDPRRAAEKALWRALEERRDLIRAAGLAFNERSHHQQRERFDDGTLLAGLCEGIGRYQAGRGTPHRLKAMAKTMKSGIPTWEELLIEPGQPWTPYVTGAARRGARAAITDARAVVPFV